MRPGAWWWELDRTDYEGCLTGNYGHPEPLVCICDEPVPVNGLGQCECGLPIVTFMRFRSGPSAAQVWPRLHARAVAAGATPEVWAEHRAAARAGVAT